MFFFLLFPFEIWMDVVGCAEAITITLLSQTCWGFKELVDNVGENNLNLALLFRKEGQIDLGLKYLLKCVENNNSRAMLYLADAYFAGGWGLSGNHEKAAEWFKKSAELGDFAAIAHYSQCLKNGFGIEKNEELSNVWAQKAFSSNNPYAIGYCYHSGVGTEEDDSKALPHFEASAKGGDDFGQEMLAICLHDGLGTEEDYDKAFRLFLPLAQRGSCYSQGLLGDMYRNGDVCERDLGKAIMWYKKAARQGDDFCKKALDILRDY